MNTKIRMIGLLVAAVVSVGLNESRGQEGDLFSANKPAEDAADAAADTAESTRYAPSAPAVSNRRPAGRGRGMETTSRTPSLTQQLRSLKSVLSLAEASDEKKGEAKQKIETLLNSYFDKDFAARQAKITEIEQRVAKLKVQLEKRRAAKSELVQLQMKLIENEAAGLGFFGTDDAGRNERVMGMMRRTLHSGFDSARPARLGAPGR